MSDQDERFSQDAISRLTPIEPSAQLRRLVAQIPIEHPRQEASWWPFKNVWLPSFSLAAAALLGLAVGQNWQEVREQNAPVAANQERDLTGDAIAYDDLDTDLTTAEFIDDAEELSDEESELDSLLILATAGNFEAEDWALANPALSDDSNEESN